MHNQEIKLKAKKLRLNGRSYNEISKILNISKSTLYDWLRNLSLSQKAKNRLTDRVHKCSLRGLISRNKNQTRLAKERMKQIHELAKNEIGNISFNDLKLIGAMLYFAEGYKRPIIRYGYEKTYHSVSFSNSDPVMIKIFLAFLKKICNVNEDKIKVQIRLYKHMNEEQVLRYWQKITKLPTKNFQKFYYGISKSSLSKRPFNRLPHGTACVRVNDTKLFHKIMGWITGISFWVSELN